MAKTAKKVSNKVADDVLLTEEQLLAMTEDDYMNDAQLAFFKARLKALESDILNKADKTTENLRETQFVPDPADRATIEEEHALELRTRDRERKLIRKIEQSIEAIQNDDYGFCETCGIEIGLRRLEARPTATLCIDCKTLAEIKEKQNNG